MPITINGKTYYRTSEICREAGISRNTFFRWLREGSFADVEIVDRRGWRLFTEADLARLKAEAHRTRPNISKIRRAQIRPEAGYRPDHVKMVEAEPTGA